jgi:hypothetical protein
MTGKGSDRRPCLVDRETYEANWARVFVPPRFYEQIRDDTDAAMRAHRTGRRKPMFAKASLTPTTTPTPRKRSRPKRRAASKGRGR